MERRAYKQARFAFRDDSAALDVVQDAMLKLCDKYSSRPITELPMLFQTILQNTIRDHFRRTKVRARWTSLFSSFSHDDSQEEFDPLEVLENNNGSNAHAGPREALEQSQVIALIEQALQILPARQREAFLLRYWEEMDVSETAKIMGCSEGSVKTHCSRATHALAAILTQKGILP